MLKYSFFTISLFACCSCVHTEEIMDSTSLNIKIIAVDNCNYFNVHIEHGHIEKIADCNYKLLFNKARGGKTILFGRTIKNLSPQHTNEVLFKINDLQVLSTNYNELIKLNSIETKEGKVYLLKL